MIEVLERIAEKSGSANASKKMESLGSREYLGKNSSENIGYSTFAEMYLENPIGIGVTASVCTWKGIPTIDDW